MTVLFAGGRLDSVSVLAGTPTEVTTAGWFDTAYCDAAISMGVSAVIEATQLDATGSATSVVSGETAFYHYEWRCQGTGDGTMSMSLHDSSGNAWIAMRTPGTGSNPNVGVYYNSGTAAAPVWTQLGTSLGTSASVKYALDIEVTLGAPHTVKVYLNGSMLVNATFTQSLLTNIRSMRLRGPSTATWGFSQILITKNRPTIGAKVASLRPTGAGGNSGWSGAFTNVNEAINSDTTSDLTTTAGVKQTYAMGDVTVPANYAIASVFHWMRAKNDGVSPLNIKSVVRQGTTDYDYATNAPGMSAGYGAVPARYDVDPGTGVTWTQSGLNASEFGYLSQA